MELTVLQNSEVNILDFQRSEGSCCGLAGYEVLTPCGLVGVYQCVGPLGVAI